MKICNFLALSVLVFVVSKATAGKLEDNILYKDENQPSSMTSEDDSEEQTTGLKEQPAKHKRIFSWSRRGLYGPSLRSWGRGFDRISYASPLSSFNKRAPARGFDRIGFSSPMSRFHKKGFRGFDRISFVSPLSHLSKRKFRGFDRISYASPLSAVAKREHSKREDDSSRR